MKNEMTIHGEAMKASLEGMLAIELFLHDKYLFRRNMLNGKVEFATKPAEGVEPEYRPLTQQALNSIVLQAKRLEICDGANPKTDIMEYVNSEDVRAYDPIREYLEGLPAWDGQNHVARLFSRIPGISSEQLSFLSIWLAR